jgi:hypothetical protein
VALLFDEQPSDAPAPATVVLHPDRGSDVAIDEPIGG